MFRGSGRKLLRKRKFIEDNGVISLNKNNKLSYFTNTLVGVCFGLIFGTVNNTLTFGLFFGLLIGVAIDVLTYINKRNYDKSSK